MKILYRYYLQYGGQYIETKIELLEFNVIRETKKGYIIKYGNKDKFVSSDESLNKFAHLDKEAAKLFFRQRLQTRIRWYAYWSDECKKGLDLCKKIK